MGDIVPFPICADFLLFHWPLWALFYSQSVNVPVLGISRTWSHTLALFLCPAYFSRRDVPKVHRCGRIGPNGYRMETHTTYRPHCPHLVLHRGTPGLLCLLAFVNDAALIMDNQIDVKVPPFNSFKSVSCSDTRVKRWFCWGFCKTLPTAVTGVTAAQAAYEDFISPAPCKCLFFLLFQPS